jgi:exopolysaccharide biosynthesis polyprenyl glycosylphosphotransferase
MSVSPSRALSYQPGAVLPHGVRLPEVDVRTWLDERAVRGWTESSRRVVRAVALFASDSVAGLLGVFTVQATWSVVSRGGLRPVPDEIPLIAMVFCLMPLALKVTRAYGGGKARTNLLKIGAGVAIAAFLGWAQARLFGYDGPALPNKAAYAYSAVVIALYAWVLRLLLDRAASVGYRAGIFQRRVLVVGSAAEAEELSRRTGGDCAGELRIVGRIAPRPLDGALRGLESAMDFPGVPLVGDVDDIDAVLSRTGADGVIVVSNMSFTRLETLVKTCFRIGATVSVLPQTLKKLSGAQLEIRQSVAGSLLQLRPVRLPLPQLAIKRTMDVVLTAMGLITIAPLLAFIATAIKLDSKGPVLFRQVRVGVGGRRFEILKFRTMVVGADAMKASLQHLNQYGDGRLFKIKDDPRITRLGAFLRKTSLDELPQLWNVLRGDMSLVGPRPCILQEFEQYEPHHMVRLHVVPGVTGPWQVNGRNEITDFEQVVRLDGDYIRRWSLWSDVAILWRTIPTLLMRKGAV